MALLTPDQLYRRCDPGTLDIASGAAAAAKADGLIGQQRAEEALRFAVGVRRRGFNLFALGRSGIGKHTWLNQFLTRQAAGEPAPADLCYVNNFAEPQKPARLVLPAGRGAPLRTAMETQIGELQAALPAAFDSDDYRTRRAVIDEQFKERQAQAFGKLENQAREEQVALIRTPMGLAMAPLREGQVLRPEAFRELPAKEQEKIRVTLERLQGDLEAIVAQVPKWEREHREEVRKLNREVTRYAVGHLLDDLRGHWRDLPAVIAYLEAVERDILEHADDFLTDGKPEKAETMAAAMAEAPSFRRYQVNVLVEHSAAAGAPVVYEDNPTHQNLVGRLEHISRFGTLITDFTLLRQGALHRANGGYLVLDAHKLLTRPFAWESLKRALRAEEIRIESIEKMLSLVSTVSLEPEPVELKVKVVLVGEPILYYLLGALDPEFNDLFKVAADFDDRIDRDAANSRGVGQLIASLARQRKLKPLEAGAIARVIEHLSRLAGDAGKMSAHMGHLVDLLDEADHWSGANGAGAIDAAAVGRAIAQQRFRADRVYQRLQEEMEQGTIRVETSGERAGQVNGLSVIALGGHSFGHPSRITARVRIGRGEVVDIEREVELGGPLHSKGVMILAGFLGGRFAAKAPLSLTASLVFEQSYGGVEGDSASSAELCALLSALADAPVRQGLAVTGSVDQHGRVQAIGGVNEKIEGFFDLCRRRGLTGDQGVIIPASNVKHLMLRDDVVGACAKGRFHVHAVETIDEGIALLTGIPAGEIGPDGSYPPGTINHSVALRLAAFARRAEEGAARTRARGRRLGERNE